MCDQPRRSAAVSRTLWWLVGGLLGLYLLVLLLVVMVRLARPLDEVAYGESWLLDGARRVAAGGGLYSPPTALPLMHFAYTPLYYALAGLLQRLLGDHGYTIGRAVSLIGVGSGAVALVFSVRRLTGRWRSGVLAAGFFLTANLTVLFWAPLARVDGLALGLSLVGLYAIGRQQIVLGAALFVAALATKQTFFIAPLATAIALWPCRARLARFLIVLIGAGAVLGLASLRLSDGWITWHIVTANANPPDLFTFAALTGGFAQFNGPAVLAALVSWTLPSRPGERLWRVYLIGGIASLVMLSKLGASSNYWLETTAATSVCLALAADRLAQAPSARLIAPTVLAGALLVAVPGYQATATAALLTAQEVLEPGQTRYVSLVDDSGTLPLRVPVEIIERIAGEPGDLLTDNSGLAVAARKPIVYEFQIFQLLHAQGVWSDGPIVRAIEQRHFALVALMHPLDASLSQTRWTPAIRRALRENYVESGRDAGFWLYRPRS